MKKFLERLDYRVWLWIMKRHDAKVWADAARQRAAGGATGPVGTCCPAGATGPTTGPCGPGPGPTGCHDGLPDAYPRRGPLSHRIDDLERWAQFVHSDRDKISAETQRIILRLETQVQAHRAVHGPGGIGLDADLREAIRRLLTLDLERS